MAEGKSAPRLFSTLANAELHASIVYNGQALLVKRTTVQLAISNEGTADDRR
jgi:hypothetical protein